MTATASGRMALHTIPFILFDDFVSKSNPERQGQGPGSESKGAFSSKSSKLPLGPCMPADDVGCVIAISTTLARFKSPLMTCWFTIQTPASHRIAAQRINRRLQGCGAGIWISSRYCQKTGIRPLKVPARTGDQ